LAGMMQGMPPGQASPPRRPRITGRAWPRSRPARRHRGNGRSATGSRPRRRSPPWLAGRLMVACSVQLLFSPRPEGAKSANRHLTFYKARKRPGLSTRLPARRKHSPQINRRQ
jgi:hypothetical protein